MTDITEMRHFAKFTFETADSEKLYAVLVPESGSDPGEKSCVTLSQENNQLTLQIAAEDISALRASMNMWLRLIAVSSEILAL